MPDSQPHVITALRLDQLADRVGLHPANWKPATSRASLFNEDERGQFAYHPAAPESWPEYAYYFGFQEQPKPVYASDSTLREAPIPSLRSYANIMDDEFMHPSTKLPKYDKWELLSAQDDFDEWCTRVLMRKAGHVPAYNQSLETKYAVLRNGLDDDLSKHVGELIHLNLTDANVIKPFEKVATLARKQGGFNGYALCWKGSVIRPLQHTRSRPHSS
jgi:hypothetical protein